MRSRLISRNILLAGLLAYFSWFSSPFLRPAVASPKPPQQTQSKRSQSPFSLTLATAKQPIKAGEPVILLAIVTNTSTQIEGLPFSNGMANVGMIYQVHVLDEQGQPAPDRPFPPKGQVWMVNVHGQGVDPGQSKEDRLNISYIYDMSRPGKYKIWIAEKYGGPDLPKGLVAGLVVSNTITVTVIK